jgi:hypothetical protein
VKDIILKLLDIMRLRGGPQNLPAQMPLARNLAVVLTMAYVAEGFIADSILGEPDTAPRSLLAITVQFIIIAALLNWRGLAARLLQTIAADHSCTGRGRVVIRLPFGITSTADGGGSGSGLAGPDLDHGFWLEPGC